MTWAPIATGGWTLVEEVPSSTFFASVRDQSGVAQVVLLVGSGLVAAIVAVLLNNRTDRVRRRGARRAEALVRDTHDVITIVDQGARSPTPAPLSGGSSASPPTTSSGGAPWT